MPDPKHTTTELLQHMANCCNGRCSRAQSAQYHLDQGRTGIDAAPQAQADAGSTPARSTETS